MLMGNMMARFAPFDFASSIASQNGILMCPAMTTCPGELKVCWFKQISTVPRLVISSAYRLDGLHHPIPVLQPFHQFLLVQLVLHRLRT
jgi:hypothetical protein